MTDKERILGVLAAGLALGTVRIECRDPGPGDLVHCLTVADDRWRFAWFVERLAHDSALVREIGSGDLGRISNDSFRPVAGMAKEDLLEGDQYRLLVKVRKAFLRGYNMRRLGTYEHRFGGIEFPTDGLARVWVRKVFDDAKYPIDIRWTPRMSIAAILRAMFDGGYGSMPFPGSRVTP